jgi:hypothetical protein
MAKIMYIEATTDDVVKRRNLVQGRLKSFGASPHFCAIKSTANQVILYLGNQTDTIDETFVRLFPDEDNNSSNRSNIFISYSERWSILQGITNKKSKSYCEFVALDRAYLHITRDNPITGNREKVIALHCEPNFKSPQSKNELYLRTMHMHLKQGSHIFSSAHLSLFLENPNNHVKSLQAFDQAFKKSVDFIKVELLRLID